MAVLTVPATAPRMDFHPSAKSIPPGRGTSPRVPEQEFLFVNSSSTLSTSESRQYKGHRDVRRFVMQKARRARPWSTSKQPEKQALQSRRNSRKPDARDDSRPSPIHTPLSFQDSATETDSDHHETRVVLAGGERCQACRAIVHLPNSPLCPQCWQAYTKYVQPRNRVGDGLFDPFHTLPVSGDVQSTDPDLWDQFCAMTSRSPIPVDVRNQSNVMWTLWTAPALKNPAFLHTLLCAAALHRYALNRGSYFCVAYHKSKAITAINTSLSDSEAGLSDENIGAVFTLLCVEMAMTNPAIQGQHNNANSSDELDQVMVHLNGLRRMVDLRGGLGNLRTNKCLESFILRHSILNSIASFDPPYLLPYDADGNFCNYLKPSDAILSSSSKVLVHLSRMDVDPHLYESLKNALIFTACLNEWYEISSSSHDPINLQNQSGVLQCRLMQWLNDDFVSTRRPIDAALCISAIIYLVLVTDSFDPNLNPLHYRAVPYLRDAIRATEFCDWSKAPQLLAWTLTMGTICAWGSPDSDYFYEKAMMAFNEFQIDSFSTLYRCLQDFMWVPYKLDEGVHRVWTSFMSPHRMGVGSHGNTRQNSVLPPYHFVLNGGVPGPQMGGIIGSKVGVRGPKQAWNVPWENSSASSGWQPAILNTVQFSEPLANPLVVTGPTDSWCAVPFWP